MSFQKKCFILLPLTRHPETPENSPFVDGTIFGTALKQDFCLVVSWGETRSGNRLKGIDLKIVGKYHDWEHLSNEIQTKMADPTSTTLVKREMQKIQQMPKSIGDLINNFTNIIVPFEVRCNVVWALIHLNLKVRFKLISIILLLTV